MAAKAGLAMMLKRMLGGFAMVEGVRLKGEDVREDE
jgi:hypothetical protein